MRRCMECNGLLRTDDTRTSDSNITRRRRCCTACGTKYTTYEIEGERYKAILAMEKGKEDIKESILKALEAIED